jgi:hypothetical protein
MNYTSEKYATHLKSNVIRKLEASGNLYYGLNLEILEPTAKMMYDVIKKQKSFR